MRCIFICLSVLIILLPETAIAGGKQLTIIHTNDLHSYFINAPLEPLSEAGQDRGGWARIAAVISREKNIRSSPVFVLDAGDFLRGSQEKAVTKMDSSALVLLKSMGYNAVTLGNHEFDAGLTGIIKIIESARKMGGIPEIIFSSAGAIEEKKEGFGYLYSLGLIKRYIMLAGKGVKVGVFSVIGSHAVNSITNVPRELFRNPAEVSKDMVPELREKGADVVVCLSHSGIRDHDNSAGEDEELARSAKGIDVIVSGHSHTDLKEPRIINGVVIVQAGEFGKQVGVLDLVLMDRVKVKKFRSINIDNKIKEDKKIRGLADSLLYPD